MRLRSEPEFGRPREAIFMVPELAPGSSKRLGILTLNLYTIYT